MDFNATIDLIIKDLNDASEIIDDLKKYPGVPILQVELAKSKCRSAGDVIALLKSLGFAEPVIDQPVHEKQPIHAKKESEASFQPGKAEFKPDEKKKEPNPARIITPPPVKKAEHKEQLKKTEENSILADKFSHKSDLYDEQSANIKTEKDLSDQLKIKTITSLSDAIGISDKFLFIGEIFDGNKEAYAQAISRLDKAENLQDAMAIIMCYTGEKPENEAVIELLELVKLKLPSNE
jgi:hypothetical protein